MAALKPRWGVSIQALILRAKDLDVISDRHSRRLFQRLSAMGWRTKEPMGIAPEKPRAVRRMAELLYGSPPNLDLMSQLTNHIPVDLLGSIIESHASAEELPARTREMAPAKIVPMATLALRYAPARSGLDRRPRLPAS